MLCPLLYRTEHFSREKQGEKAPRKGDEEGWPTEGAKRKKGRVKTGQIMDVNNYIPFSTISSQAIDVMSFWCSEHWASNQSYTALNYTADKVIRKPLSM